MGEKIKKLLRGQITTSIFYILFGLCLAFMPVETVDVLCKVVFGLLMIGAGLYHVYVYVMEKENTTIMDLFSGVLVLVLGGFLFANPQIVVKLLPLMLGAFLLVDSIWALRGCPGLRRRKLEAWKFFLVESLAFVAMGLFLMLYPFQSVTSMLMIAGWSFLANGVLDILLYIVLKQGMKKELPEAKEGKETKEKEKTQEKIKVPEENIPEWKDAPQAKGEVSPKGEDAPQAKEEVSPKEEDAPQIKEEVLPEYGEPLQEQEKEEQEGPSL